jgi:hypothetical protein
MSAGLNRSEDRGRDFVSRCCGFRAVVGTWTPSKERKENLSEENESKPFSS